MNADEIRAAAEWLLSPDAMGEGGDEIDDWLLARGVEGFGPVMREEVDRIIGGVALATGIVDADVVNADVKLSVDPALYTAVKAAFMHGFFLGLEVARRQAVADALGPEHPDT